MDRQRASSSPPFPPDELSGRAVRRSFAAASSALFDCFPEGGGGGAGGRNSRGKAICGHVRIAPRPRDGLSYRTIVYIGITLPMHEPGARLRPRRASHVIVMRAVSST